MNKFVIGLVLLGATSTAALAADLPSRRAPPVFVPPPAIPVFTWTGLYAGVNAGYAFDAKSTNNLAATDVLTQTSINAGFRPGFVSQSANGFTGGGQIGYNYQIGGGLPVIGQLGGFLGNGGTTGGLVVGVEADAAYTDLSNTTGVFGSNASPSVFHARTEYVGTARGRVGYAFGNLLVFGTGGFAYGGVNDSAFFYPGNNAYAGRSSTVRTGYAYGGGVEYAIPTTSFVNFFHSSAVTLKAEFIHYDLGSQTVLLGNQNGVGAPYVDRVKTDGNLVRGGINYKIDLFNAPSAPVVARY